MKSENLLPRDGTVLYYSSIFAPEEGERIFNALLSNVPWKNDEVILFGKRYLTARKVAWYGDQDYAYAYSNKVKHALPWNDDLKNVKATVEKVTEMKFNSCLLNLYHDGNEGMGWHSDDEKTLGMNPVIASLSLGTSRRFVFRHKADGEKVEVQLGNGSLLVMKDQTQHFWQHSLPKSKKVQGPRINLTFRDFKG